MAIHSFFNPEAQEHICQITQLIHRNCRATVASGIYLSIANRLCVGGELLPTVCLGAQEAHDVYGSMDPYQEEMSESVRIPSPAELCRQPESAIFSSGYVVHTLEAALWRFLTTDSYKFCVLKAVNLGGDTDTIGTVTDGLAGLYYGMDAIPKEWVDQLVRRDYIETLCKQLERAYYDV